jgi:transcriptional regulator with XRE-family HTH domain
LRLVPLRLKARKPKETDFEPHTLGEHIKRRRLVLKMTKRQTAVRLGVGPETVRHWESGETKSPPVERIPAILEFLGYDPFVDPGSIRDRLRAMPDVRAGPSEGRTRTLESTRQRGETGSAGR